MKLAPRLGMPRELMEGGKTQRGQHLAAFVCALKKTLFLNGFIG